MESSQSVQSLTATFTVIECPRIHLGIKSRDVREKAKFKRDARHERLLGGEEASRPVLFGSATR